LRLNHNFRGEPIEALGLGEPLISVLTGERQCMPGASPTASHGDLREVIADHWAWIMMQSVEEGMSMARILAIVAVALALTGCKAMSPNATIGGSSDNMRGAAGIGIKL